MIDAQDSSSVLVSVAHGVGRLTLNRPRTLNALDLDMVRALTAALNAWRDDSTVRVVLLDGAGDRGFCAGGDVRALREGVIAGHVEVAEQFFREEYTLNALIAEYEKPIVALADGITMGGGIGLAGHASIRVVTERSTLAMPETRIGFIPDVGGTWLLARAPGRLGEYLGLTGASMRAADAIDAGFADVFVPSERLDDVRAALHAREDDTLDVVRSFSATPDPGVLAAARRWIDDAFAGDTVTDIVARLRDLGGDAARTADTLDELSPTALVVTLESIRAARAASGIRDVLRQEYGLASWFCTQPDMTEGIRAQLVDKDRNPRWSPATVAEVPDDAADRALAHMPSRPLWG